jgi:DNA polymerase III epsilon subunit-like protein
MRKLNKSNQYHLKPDLARKLGITKINKSNYYRLNVKQIEALFNLDQAPIKRLFFDIETSPYKGYFWNAYPKFIPSEMVEEEMKVICISYKWEGSDKIERLTWDNGDDKKMIQDFLKIMKEADEIIAHNGDRYDITVLRTRAIYHRLPMMPKYRTHDTLKKSRSGFKFFSNRLDYIAQFLGVGAKVKHEGFSMWKRCMAGDEKALEDMGTYCDGDIVVLEDVYLVMQNYVINNTHAGTHNGKLRASCPSCGSEDIQLYKNDFTRMGTIKRKMECNSCGYHYDISNAAWRTFLEMKQQLQIAAGSY